jgi:hypothetical protein
MEVDGQHLEPRADAAATEVYHAVILEADDRLEGARRVYPSTLAERHQLRVESFQAEGVHKTWLRMQPLGE